MRLARRLTLSLTLVLSSVAALAQQPNVTLHSTVTGNQEQPKVMYILPWQQPGDARFEQGFSAQLSGDLFEPLDRQEFLRQLNYQALMSEADDTAEDKDTKL
jgi:hypothetical protein